LKSLQFLNQNISEFSVIMSYVCDVVGFDEGVLLFNLYSLSETVLRQFGRVTDRELNL
jgi:hypothetical protein